jgi:hypothetical protein
MKHLAAIQAEFLKEASSWNKMSLDDQRAYLKRHPKSKRRLTGRHGTPPGQQRVQEEADKIVKKIDSKAISLDMSHGRQKSVMNRLKKLYQKHKGQLYSINEGLHGADPDNLSIAVIPTKEEVAAFDTAGDRPPTKIDRAWLRDIRAIGRED